MHGSSGLTLLNQVSMIKLTWAAKIDIIATFYVYVTCQPHCLINTLMLKLLNCNLVSIFDSIAIFFFINFIFYLQEEKWAPTIGMEETKRPHANWIQRFSSSTFLYLGLLEFVCIEIIYFLSTWSIIWNIICTCTVCKIWYLLVGLLILD